MTDKTPHQKAFEAYVRSGDDAALRGLQLEGKAVSTAVASDDGYLVDPVTSETIRAVLNSTASLRQIARVVNVDATAYDVLIDRTAETGTPTIERVTIPLHEVSAVVDVPMRLLDDSAVGIENLLAGGRTADKFACAEEAAFVNGDGVDKPTGFLTHTTAANGTDVWGEIGHVVTGGDGDFAATDPGDAIINLVYSLGAQYRANGSFVMNSKTAGSVRKLKDADGRFLWSDGLSSVEPARLMGYPVLIAEAMPDIAADALAIAFGDFASGYTIAEGPDLRILRDPVTAKPLVLFYATKRVGGDVSDFNAIKVLKFAV
ncbi:phage major capsid protein [Herbaspirillum sp.]|uniref:phage major capsid protein n=1 Tax=Herbaspirillum sp. TaxID=1890675 RepID=UPI0025869D1F|nr:phage major capsid protein [Herbaspirillum sp.]